MLPAQELLSKYEEYLLRQGLSPVSIERKLSSVRAYLTFIQPKKKYIPNSRPAVADYEERLAALGIKVKRTRSVWSQSLLVRLTKQALRAAKALPSWRSTLSYTLKYRRPTWFIRYQKHPGSRYLNLGLIILVCVVLGIAGYEQFNKLTAKKGRVLGLPTVAPAYLSFQGLLTDSSGNPITIETHFRFSIYNSLTASGSAKLYEEAKWVEPDQDGIFNTLIGDTTVLDKTIFRDNTDLFLGVTVNENEEMTSRQRIATVAYAFNSQYLQGYGVGSSGANTNEIPVVDGSGNLIIAAASPSLKTTSGTFKIESPTLALMAGVGSGNIGIGTSSPTQKFQINGTGASAFVVTSTGQVGIGTASPTQKLDVNGSLNVGETGIFNSLKVNGAFFDSGNSPGTANLVLTSTGIGTSWAPASSLSLGDADTLDTLHAISFLRSDASDNYTSGTLTFNSGTTLTGALGSTIDINGELSIADTSIAFDGASTNFATTGNFSINTSQFFLNQGSGNVGIGTTDPSQKLDVNGSLNVGGTGIFATLRLSGAFYDKDSQTGTNGQILSSTGSAVDWIDMPTTGIGGSGTINYLPKFTASTTLGNSQIYDSGSSIGIGTTSPTAGYKLDVTGNLRIGGSGNITSSLIVGANLSVGNTANFAYLTASRPVKTDANKNLVSSAINIGSGTNDIAGILPITYGGTGIGTTPSSGQLLIGTSGGGYNLATIGVGNSLTITNGSGSITISHADTSNQSSLDNNDGVVIQDITLDGLGHIAGLGTVNLDNRYLQSANVFWLLKGDIGTPESVGVGNTAYIAGGNGLNTVVSSPDTLTVKLGGTLTELTKINLNSNTLGFYGTGNVGIGTTNPTQKLDISGNLNVSGTGIFGNTKVGGLQDAGNSLGTLNQVLTSTGTGVSWGTLTSLIGGAYEVPLTFSNGLTRTLNDVHWGGQLSELTKIDMNSNNIGFWNTGNIGVGTTSPVAKFNISSTEAVDLFRVDDNGAGDTTPFVIDQNGNVGIGTTGPGDKLDVVGAIRLSSSPSFVDGIDRIYHSAANGLNMQGGIGGTSYDVSLFGSNDQIALAIKAGTSNIIIPSGNVGIGTTNPDVKLKISGLPETLLTLADGTVDLDFYSDPTNHYWRIDANTTYLYLQGSYVNLSPTNFTYTQKPFRIYSSDNYLGFGASGGDYSIGWNQASDTLQFVDGTTIGSNVRMAINPSGNVGIGTTNPSQKLDINGNLNVSGTGIFANTKVGGLQDAGNALGTSGQVLTSTGTGVSWGTLASLIGGAYESPLTFINGLTRTGDTIELGGATALSKVTAINQAGFNFGFQGGNVGIGTTAPTSGYVLDVNGNIKVGGTAYFAQNVGIGTTNPVGKLHLADSGTPRLIINSTTSNGDSELLFAEGAAGTAGILLHYDGVGGAGGTGQLNLFDSTISGASLMSITRESNVGIGITDPSLSGATRTLAIGRGSSGIYGLAQYNVSPNWMISLATEGQQRLNIFDAGNVGIGTTGNKNKLDISGSLAVGSYAGVYSAPSNGMIISGNMGIGTTSPSVPLEVYSLGTGSTSVSEILNIKHFSTGTPGAGFGSALNFYLENEAGIEKYAAGIKTLWEDATGYSRLSFYINQNNNTAEAIRINKNARVAIGSKDATAKLDIEDGGSVETLKVSGDNQTNLYISESSTANEHHISTNKKPVGTRDNPSYGAWDIVLNSAVTSSSYFAIRGGAPDTISEFLRINFSGNVGIGTTGPTQKLDIVGNLNVSGTGIFGNTKVGGLQDAGNSLGSNGQVLTSIGTGVSWGTLSALIGDTYESPLAFINGLTRVGDTIELGGVTPLSKTTAINQAGYNFGFQGGNVGIGTTSPTAGYIMDVNGNLRVGNTAYIAGNLQVGNTANFNYLIASLPIKIDANKNLISGAININSGTNEISGILPITYGGTGIGATPSSGQLLIGKSDGTYNLATIGVGNSLTVTNGSGTITISHADTSNQSSLDNNNGVVIQDIGLDGLGHLTSLATVDLDSRYLQSAGVFWFLKGDTGTPESVSIGNTAYIAGGNGLTSVVSSPDTLTLAVGAGVGVSIAADTVNVDQTYGFNWTGAHSWNNTATFTNNVYLPNGIWNSSGNVGIGTTGPWSKTTVVGSTSNPSLTAQTAAMQSWAWNNGVDLSLFMGGNSPYTVSLQARHHTSSGNAYPIALNPLGGNIGIGTTGPSQKLDVAGNVKVSGSQTIDTDLTVSGIMGIGSTNPSYKLNVAGNVNVSGTGIFTNTKVGGLLDAGNSLGSNGQVLTSTGTGVSWGTLTDLIGGAYESPLTFINGLTRTGDTIELGGATALSKTTAINLGGYNFGFQGTGNVGIGTTSPNEELEVYKSQNTNTTIRANNPQAGDYSRAMFEAVGSGGAANLSVFSGSYTAGGAWPHFQDSALLQAETSLLGGLHIQTAGAAPIMFYTGGVTPTNERMRITSTGNVGIGTTSPSQKLDVVGNVKVSGSQTIDTDLTVSGIMGIGSTNPSYKLNVAGNLNVGGTGFFLSTKVGILLDKDSQPGVNKQVLSSTGTGVDWVDITSIGVGGSGTVNYLPKFLTATTLGNSQIFDNGNIGIGTTSPTAGYKLDVAGNLRVGGSGNITSSLIVGANLAVGNTANLAYLTASRPVKTDANKNLVSALISLTADITGVLGLTNGGTNKDLSTHTTYGLAYLDADSFESLATGTSGQLLMSNGNSSAPVWANITALPLEQPLIFSNGLTRMVNDIHWGGQLSELTKIDMNSNNIGFWGNGNVGIGTTNPTQKLDINGNINVGGSAFLGSNIRLSALTGSRPLKLNANKDIIATQIDLASANDITGILGVAYGGTNINGSTAPNGSLLIGNGTGYSLSLLSQGTGISITNSAGGITIGHGNTSDQASSNNNDGVVIQNVTLDDFGHLTGLGSIDLDNRYLQSAGVYWFLKGDTGTPESVGIGSTAYIAGGNGLNTVVSSPDTLTVKLGGSLTELTKINLNSNTLGFYGTGNVGIGTTSPTTGYLLDISGNLRVGGTGYFNSAVGIGITSPLQKLHVSGGDINVDTNYGFRINNTAASGQYLRGDGTRFVSSAIQAGDLPTITSAGGWTDGGNSVYLTTSADNVGIGTSSPVSGYKLDVAGNLRVGNTAYIAGNLNVGNTANFSYLTASRPVKTDANKNLVSAAINIGTGTNDITGILPITYGGTGIGTTPSSGKLLIGKSDGTYNLTNLTAGTAVTIANGSGSITLNHTDTSSVTDSTNNNGTVIQSLTFDDLGHTLTRSTVDLDARYVELTDTLWVLNGDSGTPQLIGVGNTAVIAGGNGLTSTVGTTNTLTLAVGAGVGISVGANDVSVNQGSNFAWTGTHSWSGTSTFSNNVFFPGSGIWNSGGNVGIGTTNPSQKLDINGNLNVGGTGFFTSTKVGRLLDSASSPGTETMVLYSTGTGVSWGTPATFADTDNYVDSVSFNTSNGILTLGRTGALPDLTTDLDGRYLQNADVNFYLKGDSGTPESVGIGNTVNIVGGNGLTSSVAATDTLTLAVGAGVGVSVGADNVNVDQTYGFNWTGTHSWTNTATFTGNVYLGGAGKGIWNSSGNVGIGTTSPTAGYLLDVAGNLRIGGSGNVTSSLIVGANLSVGNTANFAYLTASRPVKTDANKNLVSALISLTSDITGVLGLANGGTSKDLSTHTTYGLTYLDADSFESLATGNSGQLLMSNGNSSAPVWASTTSLPLEQPLTFSNGLTRTVNDVHWGGQLSELTKIDMDSNNIGFWNIGNIGVGTTSPVAKFNISSTEAIDLLRVDDNGAGDTTPFIIDQNGNVGVGTTGVGTYKLNIGGNLNVGGTGFLSNLSLGGNLVTSTANELNLLDGTLSTLGSIIYGDGNKLANTAVGSSGQLLMSNGAAAPVWTNTSSLSIGNAETLDGLDSTDFLRSNANDTFESGKTLTIAGNISIGGTGFFTSLTNSRPLKLNANNEVVASQIVLNSSTDVSGILPIAYGGTQIGTTPSSGQLLIGKSDGTYNLANLTGGTAITIANGSGSITLNHTDTSSITDSSNSGGTVIQSITFDALGHTLTRSTINLDNRYIGLTTPLWFLAADSGTPYSVGLGNTANILGGNGLASSLSGNNLTLGVGAGVGISVGANDVSVNQGYNFTWTGTHSWNNTATFTGNVYLLGGIWNSSGNVGIGTTNPTSGYLLDINGSLRVGNTAYIAGNLNVGNTANFNYLTVSKPVKTDANKNLVSALISLTSDITGVLGLANGGTNKDLSTHNNFGLTYIDTDSFESLATGTSGQLLMSNGSSGAPAWMSTTSLPIEQPLTFINGLTRSNNTVELGGATGLSKTTALNLGAYHFGFQGTGNVGIGMTNPSQKLDVNGNLNVGGTGIFGSLRLTGAFYDVNNQIGSSGQVLSSTGSAVDWVDPATLVTNYWQRISTMLSPATYGDHITTAGNVGIGSTASPINKLDVYGGVAIGSYAGLYTAASNNLIISGNIGIGITSPTQKLDVAGNVRIASGYDLYLDNIRIGATGSSNSTAGAYKIGAYDEFDYSSSQNVQDVLDDLDNKIGEVIGGTAGLWYDAGTVIYPTVAGPTSLGITDAGNVGIGTTNPTSNYKLDINGSLRVGNTAYVAGNLQVGNTANFAYLTASRPVKTDANKNLVSGVINISSGTNDITGILPISYGGTGIGTTPSSGKLLIGKSDGTYNLTNLTAGTAVTIANGSGSITLNHSDTSSVTDSSNSDGVVIQSITFDALGHTLTRGTVNLDSRYIGLTTPLWFLAADSGTPYSVGVGNTVNILGGNGLSGSLSSNNLTLAVGAGVGISVGANDVSVNQGYNFAWTGTNSWSNTSTFTNNVYLPGSSIWNSSGNVGIGTTSPTPGYKLDVTGNLRVGNSAYIVGNLQLGNAVLAANGVGSSGQVLLSNGAGEAPSWGTVTSGGVYTGSNGITVTGTDIELGGTLERTTTLDLNGYNFIFQGNGNVGIGTTGPASKLEVAGVGLNSTAPLVGNELVTNGSFNSDLSSWTTNGSDWTWSSGTALHGTGNTSPLYQTITVSTSEIYKATFEVSGRTVGSVTLTVSSAEGSRYAGGNGTNTFYFKPTDTGVNVTFTPTSTFNGAIDNVSVKQVGTSNSVFSLLNEDNSAGLEFRSGGSGLYNSLVGYQAGLHNTIGNNNAAFGYQALYFNTLGYDNAAFGYQALYSNISGWGNTALGTESLYSNISGNRNIAIGYQALLDNTSGNWNTSLGVYSMQYNTEGSFNTALGAEALWANTTGQENTAIGLDSLYYNTDGNENVAIGEMALMWNETGNKNTAIGNMAGLKQETGSNNVFIGYQAGYGPAAYSASGNVMIGYQAGYYENGSNKLYIANSSGAPLIYGDFSTGNVGIGTTGSTSVLTLQGVNSDATIGSELLTIQADRDFSSSSGNWTGTNWGIGSSVATHTAGNYNFTHTLTGTAGKIYQIKATINTTTAGTIQASIGGAWGPVVGQSTGTLTQHTWVITATGTGNLLFDPNATWAGTIDDVTVKEITPSNAIVTVNNSNGSAGLEIRSGGSSYNTFIGLDAGKSNDSSYDTAVGAYALRYSTSGNYTTAIGAYALASNSTGYWNTATGAEALYYNMTGRENAAFGMETLYYNTTGDYNAAFGAYALMGNTSGDSNTAIGDMAGYRQQAGSNNTFIGAEAGMGSVNYSASGNVMIGYQAGYYENGSNKLYIANSSGAPLIYGDFSTGNVGIGTTNPQAKLQVAGNIYPTANDQYDLGSDSLRWANLYLGGETLHIGTSTSDEGTVSYTTGNNNLVLNSTGNVILQSTTGNVGIGTTSPTSSYKLDVQGNVNIGGSAQISDNLAINLGVGDTVGTYKLYVDGNVLITGGTTIVQDLRLNGDQILNSSGTASIMLSASPTTAWSTLDAGAWKVHNTANVSQAALAVFQDMSGDIFTASSSETKFVIKNDGNVGIGTTGTSSYKLNVAGTLAVSNGTLSHTLSQENEMTSSYLFLSNQISGKGNILVIEPKDDDGTDYSGFWLRAKGTNGSTAGNREELSFVWDRDVSRFILATQKTGTGTVRDIEMRTGANTAQLYLSSGGKVGIGTTNPSQLLDITGGNLEITGTVGTAIADTFTGDTQQSYIHFPQISGSSDPGFIMHETQGTGDTNEGVLHLSPSDDNSYGDYVSIHGTNDPDVLKLHANGTIEGVYNLYASGNVGIGTTADLIHEFNISGSSAGSDVGALIQNLNSTGYSALRLYSSSGDAGRIFQFNSNWAGIGAAAWEANSMAIANLAGNINLVSETASGKINFFTGGNTAAYRRMTIGSTGNVGIGTTDPIVKFHIQNGDAFIANNGGNPRLILGDTGSYGDWGAIRWFSSTDTLELGSSIYPSTLVINESDKVGIGTTNPGAKLGVAGHASIGNAVTASPTLTIDASTGGFPTLQYRIATVANTWKVYWNADATNQFALNMDYGANNRYRFNTDGGAQADVGWTTFSPYLSYNYTEEGKTKDDYKLGQIVSLRPDKRWTVTPSSSKNNQLYGVVVPAEGFVSIPKELKDQVKNNPEGIDIIENVIPIAHLGEASTMITLREGQAINPGDPITYSDFEGFGTLSTKAGPIVGKALESTNLWNETSCPQIPNVSAIQWPEDNGTNSTKPCFRLPDGTYVGKIMVFVNASWHDPDVYLTSTGDILVANANYDGLTRETMENQGYSLVSAAGETIERLANFSEIAVAKIKAGLIQTTNLIAENILVERKLVAPIVETGELTADGALLTRVSSDYISPLSGNDLVIDLTKQSTANSEQGTVGDTGFGKMLVKGNAEFSGNVSIGQTLETKDASISGELYAESARIKKLRAESIEGLEAIFATMSANYITNTGSAYNNSNNVSGLEDQVSSSSGDLNLTDNTIATDSSELEAMASNWPIINPSDDVKIESNVSILGVTTLAQTIVSGPLTQDGTLIVDNGNSINVLGGTLYLQDQGGGLDLLAGKVTIDPLGNTVFEGNLTVKATLFAGLVKPLDGGDLTIDLSHSATDSSEPASVGFGRLLARGANGETVFSLDASGSAQFSGEVAAASFKIARDAVAAEPDIYGTIEATASAGLAKISAGSYEVTIKSPYLKEKSLIYLTPIGSTGNQVIYLARTSPDYQTFTAAIDKIVLTKDILFSWWIVN
jgi:hypothetical protein